MIKINLLGEVAKRRSQAREELQLLCIFLVLLVGLLLVARFWFLKQARDLQVGVDTTTKELVAVRALAHQVRSLEQQSREKIAQVNTLEEIIRAKQGTVLILDAIAKSVPDKAWLTELRETQHGLKVAGLAQDGETISNFARELAKVPVLDGVTIDVAKQSLREGIYLQEFNIHARRAHSRPKLVRSQIDPSKVREAKSR